MTSTGKRMRVGLDDYHSHDSNLAQFIQETQQRTLPDRKRSSKELSATLSGSGSMVSVRSTEVTSDFGEDSTGDRQYMGLQKRRLIDQF